LIYSRRAMLGDLARAAALLALPTPLAALANGADDDRVRLTAWSAALGSARLTNRNASLGPAVARVGELAIGTPYVANTLEEYLRAGGNPTTPEPLTLSLTRFDCVTLVESCLAVARVARAGGTPTWDRFGREVERMRYRNGTRRDYASRLHYFSEWITDGQRRGLLRDLGPSLGAVDDARPLRFMTEHRGSYVALANDAVFKDIGAMERGLDDHPRKLIPTDRIAEVSAGIRTGDVLAFATSIPGLDVTHAAMAYRDEHDTLRVLHAPLSGGAVEVSTRTLPEYVAAIRRSTGILVARPL
jgi:hypothetical protein